MYYFFIRNTLYKWKIKQKKPVFYNRSCAPSKTSISTSGCHIFCSEKYYKLLLILINSNMHLGLRFSFKLNVIKIAKRVDSNRWVSTGAHTYFYWCKPCKALNIARCRSKQLYGERKVYRATILSLYSEKMF